MKLVKVITTSPDLKFNLQGKKANSETAIRVDHDHNVKGHIRDGSLSIVKNKVKPVKKDK